MKNIILCLAFVFLAQLSFASASGGPQQVDSVSDYYGSEQSVPCLEGYACPQTQSLKLVESRSQGADNVESSRRLGCAGGYDTSPVRFNAYAYCEELNNSWNRDANPVVCSQSLKCRYEIRRVYDSFVSKCGRDPRSNGNYDLLHAATRKACGL